jgi:ERCC4-type nuclease
MKLIIDTKEKQSSSDVIISLISDYEVIRKNLDVGDFAILDDNDTILVVLERKTCKDMASSLGDGRYREQKIRLQNSEAPIKGYILEGIFSPDGIKISPTRMVTYDTYNSIILGLSIRDKLLVYQTLDTEATGKLLNQLLKKLPDYLGRIGSPVDTVNSGSTQIRKVNYDEELIKSVSTIRKKNMTPQVCYLSQLCQIPGVSHKIATHICEAYPNMRTLILEGNLDNLTNISLGKRKIGKVLAKRIVEYIGM